MIETRSMWAEFLHEFDGSISKKRGGLYEVVTRAHHDYICGSYQREADRNAEERRILSARVQALTVTLINASRLLDTWHEKSVKERGTITPIVRNECKHDLERELLGFDAKDAEGWKP